MLQICRIEPWRHRNTMEELLSVVAANLSMAGEDGETFRREAASALSQP